MQSIVQCGPTNRKKRYNSASVSSAMSISLFVSSMHLYVFNNSNTIERIFVKFDVTDFS